MSSIKNINNDVLIIILVVFFAVLIFLAIMVYYHGIKSIYDIPMISEFIKQLKGKEDGIAQPPVGLEKIRQMEEKYQMEEKKEYDNEPNYAHDPVEVDRYYNPRKFSSDNYEFPTETDDSYNPPNAGMFLDTSNNQTMSENDRRDLYYR